MKQWLAAGLVGTAIFFVAATTPDAQQAAKPAAAPASPARPYVPPKTPWGDPDIQGGWTNVNENGMPLQRPDALTGKSIDEVDDSELAEIAEGAQRGGELPARPPSAAVRPAPARRTGTSTTARRTAAPGW